MEEMSKLKKLVENHERRISKIESLLQSTAKKRISSKNKSAYDMLMVLKKNGFFRQHKLVQEIFDKLAALGYTYRRSQSLTATLQRATKNGDLARTKIEGRWAYKEK